MNRKLIKYLYVNEAMQNFVFGCKKLSINPFGVCYPNSGTKFALFVLICGMTRIQIEKLVNN